MLDLGIDLNAWPWVWLAVGVFFAIIELTVLAGSFVLLPFAVSAFAASLLGFYDVAIEIQWAVFIFGGAILWYFAYKWARKFADDNAMEPGVGAERLVGLVGIVTTAIEPNDSDRKGRVTVDRRGLGRADRTEPPAPRGLAGPDHVRPGNPRLRRAGGPRNDERQLGEPIEPAVRPTRPMIEAFARPSRPEEVA